MIFDDDLTLEEEKHLTELGERFMEGIEQINLGRPEQALKIFRQILKVEPRLAEPRMELAKLLLEANNLEEAESEAREAIVQLEASGPWNKDLKEDVIKSIAYGILGEILRQKAQSDEIIFSSQNKISEISKQAASCFKMAADLDPENEHAAFYAFHFGIEPEPEEE